MLLCGVTFLLFSHPPALKRLTDEIRSSFSSQSQITLLSASKLLYVLACLNEALRVYPPRKGKLSLVTRNGNPGSHPPHDKPHNMDFIKIQNSLAYAETRLALTKLVFNFDMAAGASTQGWMDQKVYIMWATEPLHVYLRPIVRP
ncbi:hypothetical protein MCOR25_001210 [Pyricularia grisea]|nr:hypothetical protein MCOR25_001210 [Pyricularia grisea]